MKSKKIMGLLLAGAIFVGSAAYGSYAWFTDSQTTDANITIAMGNLDIELVESESDEQWYIGTPTESFDVEWAPTDSYANVRPGDVFTRTVTVENVGTLAAKLSIQTNSLDDVILPGTEIKFSDVFELTSVNETVELAAGETTDVAITFAVKTSMGNEFNAKDGSEDLHEFNLDELLGDTEFITITADQINNN